MTAWPLRFVLAGGLVAGALDIAYACLFWAIKVGVPSGAKDPLWVGLSILVHMILIGMPIALFSRRALESAG